MLQVTGTGSEQITSLPVNMPNCPTGFMSLDVNSVSGAHEKPRLIWNNFDHMRGIPELIIKLQLKHFTKADAASLRSRSGFPTSFN
jgi:hypothetical protein